MKRVLLGCALIVAAGCPGGSTTTGPTGGGGTTTAGNGTGGTSGGGTTTTAPPKVDVPWDQPGIAWDKAPEPGPEPAFTPPAPTQLKLANGIRVLLIENHRLPLVSIQIVNARAGSREDGKHAGLASLVGDLLDEGAGELTSRTLPEELERLGADLSIAVGADASTVRLDTLTETLAPSVAVLADLVMHPTLTPEDFDRVKADTIEELKQRPDSPRRIAAMVFEQTIFGAHPYGTPGAGFVATVEALQLADARAFFKSKYTPAAATIIVAGDVDRATLEPLLGAELGKWRGARPGPAKAPPAPAATKPQLVVVDRPGAPQSVVYIGRLGASDRDPHYFPLEVVNTALGGSFASRLNHRLREELGYTYGIRSGFWRGAWGGSWTVSASFKTANTVDGIKEALAIVDRTRGEALPADELAKTKQLMTRSQPQDFETNAGIAGAYREVVMTGKKLDWPATWATGVTKVDAAAAAKQVDKAWTGLAIVVVGDWKLLGTDLTALGLPVSHVDAEGKPTK